MTGFISWLYENDCVCFVLKGAENLHVPARGHKTEKNINLGSPQKFQHSPITIKFCELFYLKIPIVN
jgi:hypothetical protein